MEIKITQTVFVKEVISEKAVNLIESERFDRVDNGVVNCVKVAPLWLNKFDEFTLLPTGKSEIYAYQFVFINKDEIHTAKLSVQDIKEGKTIKLGTYDFMYLLFENETTSYQVDRAFFENVFKRFEKHYIV